MSYREREERPAKKRRFFVEDPPIDGRSVIPDAPTPDESADNAPQIHTPQSSSRPTSPGQSNENSIALNGLDVETLNAIVGEELSFEIVEKLRKLSGNNTERGRPYWHTPYGANVS